MDGDVIAGHIAAAPTVLLLKVENKFVRVGQYINHFEFHYLRTRQAGFDSGCHNNIFTICMCVSRYIIGTWVV